ncbi:MAG: alpha/beta hydrolase-fold protein [Cyclobacteriaceae bacterium]
MKYSIIFLMFFKSAFAISQNIQQLTYYSEILDQDRSLLIYTPSEFNYSLDRKFEVIYVLDAQNREMFDFVHSSLRFISNQSNFIVVGIQSPYLEIEDKVYGRNHDMLPTAKDENVKDKYFGTNSNGNADNFMKHLEEEIFLLIQNNYRALPFKLAVGHSNSATFLSHCFLEQPDMFDAYIIQSPNYAYDNEQLVKRFKSFDQNKIKKKKFFYLSNAGEKWDGWQESHVVVYSILQKIHSDKVHIIHRQFPESEHWSSYSKSCLDGLSSFIDYQFHNAENVISYHQYLAENNIIELTPDHINTMAYQCFWKHKPLEAIEIIEWAITVFPNNDNLYDSRGEFYESIGNNEEARESCEMAIEILRTKEGSMDRDKFQNQLNIYQKNLDRVKAHNGKSP